MKPIENIRETVSAELQSFNKIFDSAFLAQDQLLQKALEHLTHRKGKQVRPLLVLIGSKLCGEINNSTYFAAASLELLHTASLVHDDVVDNTMERRRQPSVNALFDNKTAVLVGDYILTKAMTFMGQTGNIELIRSLVKLGEIITCGELLQLQHAYNIPTEEEYIEIIRKKTAILFSTCGIVAAISTNASENKRKALTDFGDYLGICFQIKDDIFDYTPKADIGKPTFNDINEGKITLPLLYSLRHITDKERLNILNTIRQGKCDADFLDKVHQCIIKGKGIEYAESRIEHYRSKAIETLSVFESCAEKEAMIDILDYVIKREI